MLSLTQGQAHATTYWEDLPKNLYYEVGRYLTSKDFKQLRNVSHAWRAGFCDHAHELVVEQCRELALLQDFKRIESLKLKVWSVPSARELQHIAALSNLRHVQLVVHKEGCVEDSLVVMLARCGTLRSFAMLPSDLPKISGQALEELVTLNALQSLDLRCCFNLTDADVATLSRCATLRSLNLSYCQQLTDQGVVTLSMLTNLSDLSLRYCRRVGDGGLRALATLTGVTALDLTVCNVSAGVVSAWAGRLRSLRSLTLSDGSYERVSDATLAAVADLTSLTRLHLAGCRQATPDGFAAIAEKLTLLTQLDLHHMQMVSWSWWHFAKQPRCVLRELHLTSCGPVVDDSGLAAVARLKQLHTLKLTRMWLSDAALQQLCASRSLQHVVLYMCTMLGCSGFGALGGIPNLETLSLHGCAISNEAVARVAQSQTLIHLDLAFCEDLDDAAMGYLAAMPSLTKLNLSGAASGLTDAGVRILARNRSLRWLDLSRCNLSQAQSRGAELGDESVSALADLPRLKYLCLRKWANITPASRGCLRALQMRGCEVVGSMCSVKRGQGGLAEARLALRAEE